jgi:two-component system, OmpR family, sensor histidine kinase KdpD
MDPLEPDLAPRADLLRRTLAGLGAWAVGWAALLALDGRLDLSNLAMLLVCASALATLWWPVVASMVGSALSVLMFNWLLVPPRGSFQVDLHQHAVLLLAMLLLNWLIAALMAARQRQADGARRLARQALQLRGWGDRLRDADDALAEAGALRQVLSELVDGTVALLALRGGPLAPTEEQAPALRLGDSDADQLAALWFCVRQGQPMGPGTGRHQELPEWVLPLRGRGVCLGAVALRGRPVERADADLRAHAQALCDQMGLALQRQWAARNEAITREQAQTQGVRNALLAAISHDYRTPLATIMGAASSLESQSDRLSIAQRRRLAQVIVEESEQLSRLTDNTLQLARLDAASVVLRSDWESAEEIVGAALRRVRRRDPERRVRARLEPGLPLLWCDGLLLAQLLDNLIDNALKYSPEAAPVEILVRRQGDRVVLAVRDRGTGVAPAWRERIFQVFHRGEPASGEHPSVAWPAAGRAPALGTNAEAATGDAAPVLLEAPSRRGAGVGLAVCRAIAQAHGGELRLRPRGHGGSSFECVLPLRAVPEPPPVDDAAEDEPPVREAPSAP